MNDTIRKKKLPGFRALWKQKAEKTNRCGEIYVILD